MFYLYLFALLVGGGLLLFSFFGEGEGDAGGDHHTATQWVSLRTLTYFLFVFGGVGAVLAKSWHSAAAPLVLLFAALAGLGVGGLASLVFRYLRASDSGDRSTDDSFVGLTGRVVLPIAGDGMGKVLVQRGDRTYELLARAHETGVQGSTSWRSVIVVEMQRGVALVAPVDDPAYREISSLSQSQE